MMQRIAHDSNVWASKASSEEIYSKSSTCGFLLMVNSNYGCITYLL